MKDFSYALFHFFRCTEEGIGWLKLLFMFLKQLYYINHTSFAYFQWNCEHNSNNSYRRNVQYYLHDIHRFRWRILHYMKFLWCKHVIDITLKFKYKRKWNFQKSFLQTCFLVNKFTLRKLKCARKLERACNNIWSHTSEVID